MRQIYYFKKMLRRKIKEIGGLWRIINLGKKWAKEAASKPPPPVVEKQKKNQLTQEEKEDIKMMKKYQQKIQRVDRHESMLLKQQIKQSNIQLENQKKKKSNIQDWTFHTHDPQTPTQVQIFEPNFKSQISMARTISSEAESENDNMPNYHFKQPRGRYVSNIKGKMQQINSLIHPQQTPDYEKLLALKKIEKKSRSALVTKTKSEKLPPLTQAPPQVLPKIIKEQMQNDDKYMKLFVNETTVMKVMPSVKSLRQPESRSRSVMNLANRTEEMPDPYQGLKQNKLSVIKYIKNNEDIQQQKLYQQFSSNKIPLKKPQLTTSRAASAFPVKKIEVMQMNVQDTQNDREQFDNKINSIISQKSIMLPSFTYGDGSKKLLENELHMRSKLMQVDQVVQEYFQRNTDTSLQNQIVKVKDVSEFKKNKQIFSMPNFTKVQRNGKLKDFYEGKINIKDHQGVEITARGERLDSYHLQYEDSREYKKNNLNQQKMIKQNQMSRNGETSPIQDGYLEGYSSDEFYPGYVPQDGHEHVKIFLKNKRKNKPLKVETADQKSPIYSSEEEGSPLRNLNKIKLNLKEKSVTPNQKKELPGDVKDLISNIRRFNNIKEQKKVSKKLMKKAKQFHNDLVEQMDEIETKPIDLPDDPQAGLANLYQTGYGSILQIDNENGGEPENKMKDSYMDIKNKTITSISGDTMGATTMGTQTIGGQTGFTGSIGNSTIVNFKKKLKEDEPPKKIRTKDDELMQKFIKLEKQQEKQKDKLKKKKDKLKLDNNLHQDIDAELKKQDQEIKQKVFINQTSQKIKNFISGKEQKEQKKKKDKFFIQNMIHAVKQKDEHQNIMKQVMNKIQNLDVATTDEEKDREEEESLPDEVSEVLSYIVQRGPPQKTEEQKKQEMKCLQAFLIECEKKKILTKQILKNLKNKTFKFLNQKIDQGLMMALTKFLHHGVQGGGAFDGVSFCQNNFQDEQLSALIDALTKPGAKVKSLVSIKNPIGLASLNSLIKLVRPEPWGEELSIRNRYLQELNINESKILNQELFKQLLTALRESCTQKLKYLGLSQQIIEDEAAQELKAFVVEAKTLKKLDLSFSKMINFSYFIDVMDGMNQNKSIQCLNIGGISAGGGRQATELRNRYANTIITLIEGSETLVHLNLACCFPGQQVLTTIIKEKSKEVKPVFVDPTGRIIAPKTTEVEEEFCGVTSIFQAVSKSKSLQVLHYSGNNINAKTLDKIKRILKIEDGLAFGSGGVQKQAGGVDAMFGNLDERMDMGIFNALIAKKVQKDDTKKKDQKAVNAFLNIRQTNEVDDMNTTAEVFKREMAKKNKENKILQPKRKVDLRSDVVMPQGPELAEKSRQSLDFCIAEKNIPSDDRFVFQRILGHQEIEHGYKWCFRDECWICAGWRYTLFIWSPSLSVSGDMFKNEEQFWMRKWEDSIIQNNGYKSYHEVFDMELTTVKGTHAEVHDCPRLVGPATNYRFRKMLPMYHFIERVFGNNRAWLRIYETKKEEVRVKELHEEYVKPVDEITLTNSNREWPYLIRNHLKQYDKQSYLSIAKMLKYGVTHDEKYYCYADVLPPNPKNISFAIQSRKVPKLSIVDQKFGIRECNAELSLKRIKKRRLKRKFELQNSLFHSWKVNLEQHYKKCFMADISYSKIHKFVKDPVDRQAVYDVLLKNYEVIFEQYLYGQGVSNYPSVSMIDFTNLCNSWKIVNKRDLSIKDIDILFFAVNFEEVGGAQGDLEDNPDKELCRYEFFEIIVRMAKLKFENQKLGLTVAQATQKLIDEYIIKMSLQQQWHGMRSRDIWTLEVHDVLEANQSGIQQFYQWWIKNISSKKGRKLMHLEDCHEQMGMVPKFTTLTIKEETKLSEVQTTLCFANAKFIVIDEMCNADALMVIKFDEFLEYIVRVADLAEFGEQHLPGWTDELSESEQPEKSDQEEEEEPAPDDIEIKAPPKQTMLIQDKVFLVIDLLLRLAKQTGLNLRAIKPSIQGLGESESDYDSF